jgi:hypothetical protein
MTGDDATGALVAGFEACTLERAKWTHAAHVTTALVYVRAYGRDEATRRMRTNIRKYNAVVGATNGYHETITLAWFAVIARFVTERGHDGESEESFASVLAALLEKCARKDYLLTHYSRELLFSNLARAEWVPPDLVRLE